MTGSLPERIAREEAPSVKEVAVPSRDLGIQYAGAERMCEPRRDSA